ncbi:Bromodomain protein [Aphelenchoides besseyi]|nr:Bromodomain protein [Aphelenchoides besseyi]
MSERRRSSMMGAPPSGRRIADKKRQKMVIEEDEQSRESESISDEETTNDSQAKGTSSPDRKPRKKRRIRLTDYNAKKRAERRQREAERKEVSRHDLIPCKTTNRNLPAKKKTTTMKSHKTLNSPPTRHFNSFAIVCFGSSFKKDPEEFFSQPVQPSVAPDYYKIIDKPMDFSAMRRKVDNNEYKHIEEMRTDVQLIGENAMSYNKPNTVYYLAAQKLLTVAKYYFSEAYLEYLRYALPFGNEVPHEILGLQPKVPIRSSGANRRDAKLESLRNAINDKADAKSSKLTEQRPNWHLGYLDEKPEGAVSLNLITGDEKCSITVGDLVGRLEKGNPCLPSDYEPIEKFDNPISYINSGPFGSFAPQFDSTWASLTKRDSDMLLACYGDRQNTTDALSLRQMASDAGFVEAIDGILDLLTDGEHSRTLNHLEKQTDEHMAEEEVKTTTTEISEEEMKKLIDEVATLENLGLDMSFLNNVRTHLGLESAEEPTTDDILRQNGQMLTDLNSLQQQRLSSAVPMSLAEIQQPEIVEEQLAHKVVQSLANGVTEFAVEPGRLVTTSAIHQAVGLNEEDDCDYDLLREFMDVN